MIPKELYEETVKSQLKVWDSVIHELQVMTEHAPSVVREEYDRTLTGLLGKEQHLREMLVELHDPDSARWEDLKPGVDSAADDMKAALGAAIQEFK